MKTPARTKKRKFWSGILEWMGLMIKTLWRKLIAKAKASESFPNEAPH